MRKTILSILSFLILTACAERPFPIDFVYVVDVQNSVCAKKEIVDKENLIFKHVEDLPLKECDGNVSIAKDDFPALKDWIKWAKKKAEECQSQVQNFGRD